MDIPTSGQDLDASYRAHGRTSLPDSHQMLGRVLRNTTPGHAEMVVLTVPAADDDGGRVFCADGAEPPSAVKVLEWVDAPAPHGLRYLRRVDAGWLWSYSPIRQIPTIPATPNDWAGAVGACFGRLRAVLIDAAADGGNP